MKTMSKNRFWYGMLAAALVLGMMIFTACGSDDDDSGGTFTLTDIPPQFNGQYAYVWSDDYDGMLGLVGVKSINVQTDTGKGGLISNGKVSVPMWVFYKNSSGKESYERYSGNEVRNIEVWVGSFSEASNDDVRRNGKQANFSQVRFSNGSATISYSLALFPFE